MNGVGAPCATQRRLPGTWAPQCSPPCFPETPEPPTGPFGQDQATPILTAPHGMLAPGRARLGSAGLASPRHMPRPGALLSMMLCSSVWGSWPTAWSRCCSSLLMLDTGMPKDCTNSSSCWGSRSCKAEGHTRSASAAQGAARDPHEAPTCFMAACKPRGSFPPGSQLPWSRQWLPIAYRV